MATAYTDAAFGARSIGDRTDNVGSAVTDVSAEEDRYANKIVSQGVLAPLASFVPVSGGAATWDVTFGSGGSKTDYYVVEGTTAGQGNYIVRLPADQTIAINAAHASLDRFDEIYLVVQDNAYDSSGNALPRLAYRDGTAAGSPTLPGPDAGWDAYALLATIEVTAAASDIDGTTITDERTFASIALGGADRFGTKATGTLVSAPSGESVDFEIDGTVKASISASGIDGGGSAITNVGDVDGVDVGAHDHGSAGGAAVSHTDLSDLGSGDPHPQYATEADVQGIVAGENLNASTLDGIDSTGFALSGHSHSSTYLGLTATAAKATKLATARTISLTGDLSGSAAFDGSANIAISAAVANDSHTHNGTYYTESEANGRYYGTSTAGKKITISTSAASGGSNGDIWLEY